MIYTLKVILMVSSQTITCVKCGTSVKLQIRNRSKNTLTSFRNDFVIITDSRAYVIYVTGHIPDWTFPRAYISPIGHLPDRTFPLLIF